MLLIFGRGKSFLSFFFTFRHTFHSSHSAHSYFRPGQCDSYLPLSLLPLSLSVSRIPITDTREDIIEAFVHWQRVGEVIVYGVTFKRRSMNASEKLKVTFKRGWQRGRCVSKRSWVTNLCARIEWFFDIWRNLGRHCVPATCVSRVNATIEMFIQIALYGE